jgi:hypothetical protein
MSMLDAAKGLDLIGRKERPMACCPRCEEATPLVSTMAFRYFEFYCLECGGHFGFLEPRPVDVTPELTALEQRLHAEWDEHAGAKLTIEGHQPVSERAGELHAAAMAWLDDRKTR